MAAMPHREFCITIGMGREMNFQSAGEEKEIERKKKKKKNIRLKSGEQNGETIISTHRLAISQSQSCVSFSSGMRFDCDEEEQYSS